MQTETKDPFVPSTRQWKAPVSSSEYIKLHITCLFVYLSAPFQFLTPASCNRSINCPIFTMLVKNSCFWKALHCETTARNTLTKFLQSDFANTYGGSEISTIPRRCH